MVALGTSFAALAFLGPHELLEFPMQLLDLPTHGVLVLNVVRSEPSNVVRSEPSLGSAVRSLIVS